MEKDKQTATVLYQRRSVDGFTVCLWSDGHVTDRVGTYATRAKVPSHMTALLADHVHLYKWHQMPALVRAAQQVQDTGDLYARCDAFRAIVAELLSPRL